MHRRWIGSAVILVLMEIAVKMPAYYSFGPLLPSLQIRRRLMYSD